MVRALASHQCGLGSIPGPGVICGLSLLLVLSLLREVTFPNASSIWNALTRLSEFLRALRCYVDKQIAM